MPVIFQNDRGILESLPYFQHINEQKQNQYNANIERSLKLFTDQDALIDQKIAALYLKAKENPNDPKIVQEINQLTNAKTDSQAMRKDFLSRQGGMGLDEQGHLTPVARLPQDMTRTTRREEANMRETREELRKTPGWQEAWMQSSDPGEYPTVRHIREGLYPYEQPNFIQRLFGAPRKQYPRPYNTKSIGPPIPPKTPPQSKTPPPGSLEFLQQLANPPSAQPPASSTAGPSVSGWKGFPYI